MNEEIVVSELVQPGIRCLTVNRPEALNALNPEVLVSLREQINEISGSSDIRAVLLRGAGGKAFVAGADVAHMQQCSGDDLKEFIALGQDLMLDIERCPVPVIAVVEGFALGGGLELAIACDVITASPKSRFGAPEVKLGIIPGFGGTQRLILRCGIGQARRLVFSGEMIDAAEAKSIGLVDIVSEDPYDAALSLASSIAARAPLAVRAAKTLVNRFQDSIIKERLSEEVDSFLKVFRSDDAREGVSALLDKREPKFGGK